MKTLIKALTLVTLLTIGLTSQVDGIELAPANLLTQGDTYEH